MKMETKFWITLSYNGHFKDLHIKRGNVEKENLEDFIVFETEAEAENFKSKLQDFIINNYPDAKVKKWYK